MKKPKLQSVRTTGLGYPNIPADEIPKTRKELYASDRGEKEYLESKKSLTEPIRLPITRSGWAALLDIVTKVAGIPNDERSQARIFGYVHHLGDDVNYTTLGQIVNVLLRDCAIDLTWEMDQEIKENKKKAEAEKKEAQALSNVTPFEEPTVNAT